MKRMIYALMLMSGLFAGVQAQDKGPDTVAFSVGVTNITLPGENLQGVNAQGQVKLVRLGNFTINAAGDFVSFFIEGSDNAYTFQAGPRVGLDLGDRKVTLYGEILFGGITTFNDDAVYAYAPGGGIDINVTKRVFFRGGYNRQFVRDAGDSFNRVTGGIGVRF